MGRARIPPNALRDVLKHAAEGHPREVCGILLASAETPDDVTLARPMANLAQGPDAFLLDAREHLRVLQEAASQGLVQRLIYHSHGDAPAHFSVEDRAHALWDGQPAWPGVDYLVVGSRGGQPEAVVFTFVDGEWAGRAVPIPSSG
jgi:proteasome lid subunit RPN8/RPN11